MSGVIVPPPALHHTAGFYDSRSRLMSQIVPLLRAGLDRGGPVALAVLPSTQDALRDAFGDLGAVTLLDHPDEPVGSSGQTMVVRRARQLRELTGGTGPVTLISEHCSRFDGPDGRFWNELEAAINTAMADIPLVLTCFYPDMPLHQSILDGVQRNHRALLVDGSLRPNAEYRPPQEALTEIPAAAPVLLGPPDLRLALDVGRLSEVRAEIEKAMLAAGYRRDRAEDVVFAVNEVTTNAVQHGTAPAEVHLWTAGGACVFEVHDSGELGDPLPGVRPPHRGQQQGWGVWIARQTCDALHVWRDDVGTHVRVHAGP